MLVFAFLVNVNFAYINCCNFVRPALVSVIVLGPLDNEKKKPNFRPLIVLIKFFGKKRFIPA